MTQTWDIDLRFAENGREAVALWEEFRPDVIFMDISMPEMDGREAARAIRAQELTLGQPAVPIVALTAHAMDGDAASILAAGIDRYLTKPLRKVALEDVIAGYVTEGVRPPLPVAPSAKGDLAQEGSAEPIEARTVEVAGEIGES
jgi:CheY-like chemotaxis protein